MKMNTLLTFMLAAGLFLVLVLSPVHANSITVNTAGDSNTADGVCSLREAIVAANTDAAYNGCTTGSGADTISFAGDYTITLNGSQLPVITSTITINGNGPANTIIRAHANFNTAAYRVIQVGAAGNLTLDRVTVKNGAPLDSGGGIYNSGGTLTVTNSLISDNLATFFGGYGGGIYNEGGTITVANSTISDNSAPLDGGGIYNNNGTMTLANNTISSNLAFKGGGIFSTGGVVIVTNNTVSSNSGIKGGGGIYSEGILHLAGNIFAAGDDGENCFNDGTFNDNGYNLSDDDTCTTGNTGSLTNATLNLGPLADNGGPTLTQLPSYPSDAIGAIPNGTIISNGDTSWTCNDANTFSDQRGESRPILSGDDCTAGAVEVIAFCPSWMVSTADELYGCISLANANESPDPSADIITLGADFTLTSTLPQITSTITLEGAGYTIDGGNSVQIFIVGSTGNLTVNQATLQKGGGSEPLGGAVENSGILRVTNSTFSGNATIVGGGIWNDGTLTVTNSTFSDNSGVYGGGIWNGGTLTVTSSTFSGNLGSYRGGAMYNEGTAHLAANIFAAGVEGANCFNDSMIGTLTDNGYNLSDDDTCGFDASGATGSADNATLNLGVLADNGGPTPTHLPELPSEAIGTIPNGTIISNHNISWTCNDVDTFTDQRGESRPLNSGDDCTAGAVEVGVVLPLIFHDGFE